MVTRLAAKLSLFVEKNSITSLCYNSVKNRVVLLGKAVLETCVELIERVLAQTVYLIPWIENSVTPICACPCELDAKTAVLYTSRSFAILTSNCTLSIHTDKGRDSLTSLASITLPYRGFKSTCVKLQHLHTCNFVTLISSSPTHHPQAENAFLPCHIAQQFSTWILNPNTTRFRWW